MKKRVLKLLKSKSAHDNFNKVSKNFPINLINKKIPGVAYTPWHLIEHIRIAQKDIIDFTLGKEYKDLDWPKQFWPNINEKATEKKWNETIKRYNNDLDIFIEVLKKSKNEYFFKQALLIADHTAYHVGELAIIKTILNELN